jgi:hypothetical protein
VRNICTPEGRIIAPADQQLAACDMGHAGVIIFIVFDLALLAAWLGEPERRVHLGATGARLPGRSKQRDTEVCVTDQDAQDIAGVLYTLHWPQTGSPEKLVNQGTDDHGQTQKNTDCRRDRWRPRVARPGAASTAHANSLNRVLLA